MSADRPETQQSFIDAFSLTFPILPDTEKRVIDDYGARAVLGIVATRSTFLIDPDGVIAAVWPKVQIEGHADDVIAAIRSLSAQRARAGTADSGRSGGA